MMLFLVPARMYPTVITASAPGFPSATLGVTVTPPAAITLPANTTVGLGQSVTLPVTLPAPAPAGGGTIQKNIPEPEDTKAKAAAKGWVWDSQKGAYKE